MDSDEIYNAAVKDLQEIFSVKVSDGVVYALQVVGILIDKVVHHVKVFNKLMLCYMLLQTRCLRSYLSITAHLAFSHTSYSVIKIRMYFVLHQVYGKKKKTFR